MSACQRGGSDGTAIMGISGNTSKMQSAYKVGGYKTSEKSQLKKKKKSNRNGYDSKSSFG